MRWRSAVEALAHPYGILSIAPAILAIALAVVSRNVIASLVTAVLVAGMIFTGSAGKGIVHAVDETLVGAIADADHAKTMLFTLLIGGMVGVVGQSGATRALVEALARRARSPRSVQVLSWLSGLVVFFDDYANCMIVGSSMGPLYDEHRISRDKLAYIVDSTAAPVASLALVSTWVGFEVGVIQEGLDLAGQSVEPYAFFIEGWAYRFYPILALVFVGAIALSGRDFGPMARPERRPPPSIEPIARGATAPWWAALAPILVLVAVTLGELWRTGRPAAPDGPLFRVLENADGYGAIVHGALASLMVAFTLTLATGALGFADTMKALSDGMKLMFEALVVLVLAWALSSAMKELSAPQYLVSLLRTALPAALLPTVTFVVGAAISFAVGSSYTTMGILMPMVVPLAFELSPGGGIIPLAASGSVLAGACFGDHCSPISDTTVLSSIGSGSELLAHVRTQLPYALAVGIISIVFGTLPAGYGLSPWLGLALGAVACLVVVRVLGRPASLGPRSQEAALEEGGGADG